MPTKRTFPELVSHGKEIIEQIDQDFKPDFKTTIYIELPYVQGQFAPGLYALIGVLVTHYSRKVGGMVFFNGRGAQFLLQQRKSDKKKIVKYMTDLFGLKGKITDHEADALVLLVLIEYDRIRRKFLFIPREPSLEMRDVKW